MRYKRIGVALAVVAALAVTPAYAADAVSAAANFTSMALAIGNGIAIGLFVLGLVLAGLATLAGMPKMATGGKGAMILAVLIGISSTVLGFFQSTVQRVIG